MKKIFLAATFIIICSLTGMAQNLEKALKNGKWYANAELGSKTITLTKTAKSSFVFDMELANDITMKCGQTAKADFVDNEGRLVKAGTYYVDVAYGYKINGNTIAIIFQPTSWNYNVKTLTNGDLSLELIAEPTKSTK